MTDSGEKADSSEATPGTKPWPPSPRVCQLQKTLDLAGQKIAENQNDKKRLADFPPNLISRGKLGVGGMLPPYMKQLLDPGAYYPSSLAASAFKNFNYHHPPPVTCLEPMATTYGSTLRSFPDPSLSITALKLASLNRRRKFQSIDNNDERPSPLKKPKPVPEEQKDSSYWERRRKNNDAAKRSRDSRRAKEDEIALRAVLLEKENMRLRAEVTVLKNELARLHYLAYSC